MQRTSQGLWRRGRVGMVLVLQLGRRGPRALHARRRLQVATFDHTQPRALTRKVGVAVVFRVAGLPDCDDVAPGNGSRVGKLPEGPAETEEGADKELRESGPSVRVIVGAGEVQPRSHDRRRADHSKLCHFGRAPRSASPPQWRSSGSHPSASRSNTARPTTNQIFPARTPTSPAAYTLLRSTSSSAGRRVERCATADAIRSKTSVSQSRRRPSARIASVSCRNKRVQ